MAPVAEDVDVVRALDLGGRDLGAGRRLGQAGQQGADVERDQGPVLAAEVKFAVGQGRRGPGAARQDVVPAVEFGVACRRGLHHDQVAGLRADGVEAACIHSGMGRDAQIAEWVPRIAAGEAPVVTSTTPADGATAVSLNAPITATFGGAMAPLSITAATFSAKSG